MKARKKPATALEELLRVITGATDPEDDLRARAMQEHIDSYVKSVVTESSGVMDEVFEAMKHDPCSHRDHRMVPTGRDDFTAIFNMLHWLIQVHLGAAARCIHGSYEVGKAVAEAAPLPSCQRSEALYEVTAAIMIHFTELLREPKMSMLDFYPKLEAEVRKTVTEQNEVRLTGKQAEEKPKHAHCH